MVKLQIMIPIKTHREEMAKRIEEVSCGIDFDWEFYDQCVHFESAVNYKKELSSSYLYEVNKAKEWFELCPTSEPIKNLFEDIQKEENKKWEYDVEILFEADVPIEIDFEYNDVVYYTGPSDFKVTNRERHKLKAYIEHDRLDEFYYINVRKCVLAIIMSYVLTWPDVELLTANIEVLFDGQLYHKDNYLRYAMHNDGYRNHKDIVTTELSFNQTMDWIKNNTSLFDNVKKSPVAFSSLTYILNREIHESLLYSIIGLESIYTPKSKGITFALQRRLNHIFPMVTKEEIKELYQSRSKFVHGEMRVGNYQLSEELVDDYLEMDESATLATALLLESLRILIANNATTIQFTENIEHHFI